MEEIQNKKPTTPSFWKRASASWIDLVLLIGLYLILGFVSEHLFSTDAYPPAREMQSYSERDFLIYWFFVCWSMILSGSYLLISYIGFKGTLGQKLVGIELRHRDGSDLKYLNIGLRVLTVIVTLALIMIPGPLVAIAFLLMGSAYLNEAMSFALLLSVVLFMFYISFTRYGRGKTRSIRDILSMTIMIETDRTKN